MFYTCKDTADHILSYLRNFDKFHFIVTNKYIYENYRYTLDPSENDAACLKWAVEQGDLELVKLCLRDARIDIGKFNYAIYIASSLGYSKIVQTLLQDPRVDPSTCKNAPIIIACEYGYTSVAKLLLRDPRVDPSDRDSWAIKKACDNGHISVVRALLQDRRADPSVVHGYYYFGNCCITSASEKGYTEIVRALLQDSRVDPGVLNNRAIRNACMKGHVEIVKLLLNDPRVDPSAQYNECIRTASLGLFDSIVALLLNDPRVDPTAHFNFVITEVYERRVYSKRAINTLRVLISNARVKNTLDKTLYNKILNLCK